MSDSKYPCRTCAKRDACTGSRSGPHRNCWTPLPSPAAPRSPAEESHSLDASDCEDLPAHIQCWEDASGMYRWETGQPAAPEAPRCEKPPAVCEGFVGDGPCNMCAAQPSPVETGAAEDGLRRAASQEEFHARVAEILDRRCPRSPDRAIPPSPVETGADDLAAQLRQLTDAQKRAIAPFLRQLRGTPDHQWALTAEEPLTLEHFVELHNQFRRCLLFSQVWEGFRPQPPAPSAPPSGAKPGVFRDARRAWSALALELPEQVHDDAGRVILAAISEGERLSVAPEGAADGGGANADLEELRQDNKRLRAMIEHGLGPEDVDQDGAPASTAAAPPGGERCARCGEGRMHALHVLDPDGGLYHPFRPAKEDPTSGR